MKKILALPLLFLLCFSTTIFAAYQWNPSIQVTPAGTLPVVKLDASGNSVALWVTTNGSGDQVLMSGTLPPDGTTWSPLVIQAEIVNTGIISNLQLALDASGDAVAVWQVVSPEGIDIYYSSLPFGGSAWSTPFSPSTPFPNESATNPGVGVDASGNAVVIWQAFSLISGNTVIRSEFIPFGTTTDPGTTVSLSTDTTLVQGFTPSIAMDSSGKAIAMWEAANAGLTSYNVEANTYTEGTGWSGTVNLYTSNSPTPYLTPLVAIDSSGNGGAVWYIPASSTTATLQGARYLGGIWTITTGLPTATVAGGNPHLQIVVDNGGAVLVSYLNANMIQSATLPSASTIFGNLQFVTDSANAGPESLSITPSGLATVVWTNSSTGVFQASMLANPSSNPWSTPVTLDTSATPGLAGSVAGNALGEFITVWPHSDGSLRSAFYGPAITPPFVPYPVVIDANRIFNQFLLQAEVGDYFTFSPLPPSTGVVAYAIYTDSALTHRVGYISASAYPLQIAVHNVRKTAQTYYIVSVNGAGDTSTPIVITL